MSPYFAASLRFGETDVTSELLELLFVMLTDIISTIHMENLSVGEVGIRPHPDHYHSLLLQVAL